MSSTVSSIVLFVMKSIKCLPEKSSKSITVCDYISTASPVAIFIVFSLDVTDSPTYLAIISLHPSFRTLRPTLVERDINFPATSQSPSCSTLVVMCPYALNAIDLSNCVTIIFLPYSIVAISTCLLQT